MSPFRFSSSRSLELLLLLVGVVLLGTWFHNDRATRLYQSRQTLVLERAALLEDEGGTSGRPPTETPGMARPRHMRTRAIPATPDSGQPLGRIEAPRLGISAVIAQGTGADLLDRAVGHFEETALPGEPGNCALAGHRDTFLRGLRRVRTSDTIRIVTPERTYSYRVSWGRIVEPEQIEVLEPTAKPSLTLVTCYPFEMVGHAPLRFVLRARLVGTSASALKTSLPLEEIASAKVGARVFHRNPEASESAKSLAANALVPRHDAGRAWHGTRHSVPAAR